VEDVVESKAETLDSLEGVRPVFPEVGLSYYRRGARDPRGPGGPKDNILAEMA
jgi:hypothetical protein